MKWDTLDAERNAGITGRTQRGLVGAGRAIVVALTLVGVGGATIAAGTGTAAAAGNYQLTADVNVRQSPGTGGAYIKTEPKGASFSLKCQVQGSTSVNGNQTWDNVQFTDGTGGYITDYWTTTPSFNSYAPGTGPCGGSVPGRPPASARNIGYNPYAAHFSDQCTYYAEQRMANQTGMYMPVYGNANQFADQARAGGWTVGTTPAVNSVSVFPAGAFGSSVGHVAWVIGISGNTLHIQDYNWNYVGAHVTDHWVTIPAGTQYIYSDR